MRIPLCLPSVCCNTDASTFGVDHVDHHPSMAQEKRIPEPYSPFGQLGNPRLSTKSSPPFEGHVGVSGWSLTSHPIDTIGRCEQYPALDRNHLQLQSAISDAFNTALCGRDGKICQVPLSYCFISRAYLPSKPPSILSKTRCRDRTHPRRIIAFISIPFPSPGCGVPRRQTPHLPWCRSTLSCLADRVSCTG